MRIEQSKVEAMTIYNAGGFDPILVCFNDLGDGRGRLLIECYGWTWATYWGAMGTTVKDFVARCGVDYIANNLTNNQRRVTKVERDRLEGIVRHVKIALASEKQPAALETSAAPGMARSQVIARARMAHWGQWPDVLTSDVMFWEGERITRDEFAPAEKSACRCPTDWCRLESDNGAEYCPELGPNEFCSQHL